MHYHDVTNHRSGVEKLRSWMIEWLSLQYTPGVAGHVKRIELLRWLYPLNLESISSKNQNGVGFSVIYSGMTKQT